MDIAEHALTTSFAQQTALAALIMTHPDPAKFAATLSQLTAGTQIEWAQEGLATGEARDAARSILGELLDIAHMEAERRRLDT